MCANNSALGDSMGIPCSVGGRLSWLPSLHFVCAGVFMSDLDHHTLVRFPSQRTKYMFIVKKQEF